MAIRAPRDENRIPCLLGTSKTDGLTPIEIYADDDTNRLYVDALIAEGDNGEILDTDDDSIAKAQEIPIKIVENYIFDKTGDVWNRMQGSTDGYQFVRPIGIYDSAGHSLDIEVTTGALYTNMKAYRSSDTSYQPVRLDKATNTLQTIEYEHHEIHAGSHYFVHGTLDIPALGDVLDFTWLMPDNTKWIHWTWSIETSKGVTWYVYEDAIATNPLANTVTPLNSDRNSGNSSGTTMKYEIQADLAAANADTNVTGATLLESGVIGDNRTAGDNKRENELVLKQGKLYVMRAVATAASTINFKMNWYEHTNIA